MAQDNLLSLLGIPGGASPLEQAPPATDIAALLRTISQGSPVVPPTEPAKIPFAQRGLAGIADALNAYSSTLAGRATPPSVLKDLMDRRQQTAERDTARRQAAAEREHEGKMRGAAVGLQRAERGEDRADRAGERALERSDRAAERAEARTFKLEQEAAELQRQKVERLQGMVREAGYYGIHGEGMSADELDVRIGEAKRSLDDYRAAEDRRLRERSADAKETPEDKFSRALDEETILDVQTLVQGTDKTPGIEARLSAITDPAQRVKEAQRIRTALGARRRRVKSKVAFEYIDSLINNEVEPLLRQLTTSTPDEAAPPQRDLGPYSGLNMFDIFR